MSKSHQLRLKTELQTFKSILVNLFSHSKTISIRFKRTLIEEKSIIWFKIDFRRETINLFLYKLFYNLIIPNN